MFKSLKRITYKVADVMKAKQWYGEFLDSQPIFETPFSAIFKVGDCTLSLSLGKEPLPENTERCEIYWEVEDIDAAYQRLVESGAQPHTPIKAVLNIRIAKVVDPFGNIIGITGAARDAKERAVEYQPSETAMSVAFCRALAAMEDRMEIKGPDYMAELFLTEEAKKPLKDGVSRSWAIQKLVTAPLYGYVLARTAFFDGIFKKALAENIPQIVFLGAGYDTRAYRYRELIQNTQIYELDIQSTQNKKIAVLKGSNVSIPKQVSLVNINFKVDRINDVLGNAGYSQTAKTLFIWEGVTYYLTDEAINRTLSFIKSQSPKGSAICFDYATDKLESFNAAEPFQFHVSRDGMAPFLANFGIKIVEHLDSKEMERRYLTLTNGSLAEKTLSQFNLVYGVLL
jgi:methyltransferase (TIGR00027 family)